jgi:hypothetical protein
LQDALLFVAKASRIIADRWQPLTGLRSKPAGVVITTAKAVQQ